ncbi:MAG: SUMF1/EgtB/PvdO family nonheme iron enzyme [Planctomycetota bacterium]
MRAACAAVLAGATLAMTGYRAVVAEEAPRLAVAPFRAEQARAFQEQWAKQLSREVVETNSIGMKMVLLPPGEFTMGRTEEQFAKLLALVDDDPELKKNRGGMLTWSMLMMPAHRVRITKPFFMGATEVTVGQFRRFVEAAGYKTEAEQGLNHGKPYQGGRPMSTWRKPMAWRRPPLVQHDDEPVLQLCWNDCVAFCGWLSEKEGRPYCLPTEAEWEYACRSGTTTPWHFGDYDDFDRVAHEYAYWSDGAQAKHDRPRSVGLGKPNAFGLYDMHGNVWEYVADWWHRLSYKQSPINDPAGPDVQSEKNDLRRIIRGGSFDWGRWGGDAAYRMRITQRSNQHPHMGFRVAMRLEGVDGVSPAVDPKDAKRRKKRDPGADSEDVVAALKGRVADEERPGELTIDLGGGVTMPFVLIPAGSFLMGSEKGAKDEMPQHRVVISRPFYMAEHEVTQSQWEAVMGPDARLAELRRGDHEMSGPTKAMNGLSWNACQGFVGRLKAKAPGHAFSLPTEAQWEYACRAGSAAEFHFGDDEARLGEYAWFAGNMNWPGLPGYQGKTFYHDVGKKKRNSWGLYDVHGGVWEWCADWYDEDTYFDSPLKDPAGPESGRLRVLRGGSWFRYARYARCAYRRPFHPACDGDAVTAWILDFGCRIVINLGENGAGSLGVAPSEPPNDRATVRLAENLVRHDANPVLDVGKPGDWDDGRCGCFSVEQVDGLLCLYYMGSGSKNAWRIGLATSADGVSWQRFDSNPILPQGAPGSWDDRQVSMPYVLNDDGKLYMWYTGSGRGGGFGLATSSDGVSWKRHGTGPVMRGIGGSMDPCVRKLDGRFVMWYVGKRGKSFRIFRATSPDAVTWTREPEPVLPLGEKGDFDETYHVSPRWKQQRLAHGPGHVVGRSRLEEILSQSNS